MLQSEPLKTNRSCLPSQLKSPTVELDRLVELPAWHGPIVAGEQVEAVVAVIGEQAQVGNDSYHAVVTEDFILAVAIEVADVELVVSRELPVAWHNGDRIEDDVQLRAIGAVECPTGCATSLQQAGYVA